MNDAAIGIVLDPQDDKRILWVKRRDLAIWVLPGGGIDAGETPEEAVLREVEEEAGITVSIVRKGAVLHPVSRWTKTTHLYVCQVKAGTPFPQAESAEVGYFPISTPPEPHFPLHEPWALEVLATPERVIKRPLAEFSWKKVGRFFLKHPLILLRYLFIRLRLDFLFCFSFLGFS